MTTDTPSTFETRDMMRLVGYDMAKAAAEKVYEASGVGPDEIRVAELHDCFAQNELITYEALGLCPEGGAAAFIADGDNTYGGRVVTNPSGGLLSKGHPLGATGLAQCYELTRQLRGTPARPRSRARATRSSTISASAAPASSRCTSGPDAMVDASAIGMTFRPTTPGSSRAAFGSSSRRSARPTRSIATTPPRGRRASPRARSRRPISSASR